MEKHFLLDKITGQEYDISQIFNLGSDELIAVSLTNKRSFRSGIMDILPGTVKGIYPVRFFSDSKECAGIELDHACIELAEEPLVGLTISNNPISDNCTISILNNKIERFFPPKTPKHTRTFTDYYLMPGDQIYLGQLEGLLRGYGPIIYFTESN